MSSAPAAVGQTPEATSTPSSTTQRLDEVLVQSTPIETTAFLSNQPISVVSDQQLLQTNKITIGEILSNQPGVSASSFGPGSSRPVIRGLGGDRVRILQNGVGTLDVSNTSPDHAVTVEPMLADRIEIVRGPAALLYGTTAVGGVVNVLDGRIPEELPEGPVSGKGELRGGSVDNQKAGVLSANTSVGSFAVHADGFYRQTDDLRIPGYARTEALRRQGPPEEFAEPRNRLPFSATESGGANIGTSYILDNGFLGGAVGTMNNIYGVPNGEKNIRINIDQTRYDLRGRLKDPVAFAKSVEMKVGFNDYKHTEYEDGSPGTVFSSKAIDSRVEVAHHPMGPMNGIVGLQLQGSDFSAVGAEAFQPPTDTRIGSLFAFEEVALDEQFRLSFGGRLDSQSVAAHDYLDPRFPETGARDETQNFFTTSGSLGGIWSPSKDYALALTFSHTERAPVAQELFANGPHVATAAFEIGNTQLNPETSNAWDLSLRKRTGRITGSVGVYYNRVHDYIGLNPTGENSDDLPHEAESEVEHSESEHSEDEHAGHDDEGHHADNDHADNDHAGHGHADGLPIFAFTPQEAEFYGLETQVKFHFMNEADGSANQDRFDLILQPDYVWARDVNTSEAIARIPPFRFLSALEFKQEAWFSRLESQHVFRQDRTATFETETGSYTFWNASVNYTLPLLASLPAQVFLNGENLTNELGRNHISFIKDIAPLPGRNISAGVRISF